MSSSLFLTNWLFCTGAALILIYLLRFPHALTNKNKGILFLLLGGIVLKLFIPFEFSFTVTIPISVILTYTREKEQSLLFGTLSIKSFLIFIWLSVAFLILIYTLYKRHRLKRLFTHIPETSDAFILHLTRSLCEEENIRQVPAILQIDTLASPFVFGLRKPVIVLPKGMQKEHLKMVLLHELQHIKLGHLYIKFLANFVTIVHWWLPVVWLLNTKLSQALEYQVDYFVTKKISKEESVGYMSALIDFAKLGYTHTNILAPLSFADNQRILKHRIAAITDSIKKQSKTALTALQKVAILAAFLLLMFPLFYTFEASYNPSPEELDGSVSITPQNSYFMTDKDGTYHLYVDDQFFASFEKKPNSFQDIKVKSLSK